MNRAAGHVRSPPDNQIQASGLIGSPTVPGCRKAAHVVVIGHSRPLLHEGTNRRGSGIKQAHLVLLDHLQERNPVSRPVGAPSYITVVAPDRRSGLIDD